MNWNTKVNYTINKDEEMNLIGYLQQFINTNNGVFGLILEVSGRIRKIPLNQIRLSDHELHMDRFE